ncbi:MAG: lysophospholipid acyltransferase family protein [Dehalococcoidia bacterium]
MWKYVAFLIAVQTLGRLPVGLGYALAGLAGRLSYLLTAGQRQNVIANLRQVMGKDAPESKVRAAARGVFVNVAKYYVDTVHMPHMDLQAFYDKRFRYEGFDEYFLPALAEGRGVVCLSVHLGNPELGAQGVLPRGVKVFALTEPVKPPRLARLVNRLRSSKGNTFQPVGFAGVKQAMLTLRKGGAVALMGDRDIDGPKARLPFFGRETLMPTGPMEVALRTGAAVIPTYTYRPGGTKIVGVMAPPMELERSGDTEKDAVTNTRRFLEWAERPIREHPDQWSVLESVWDDDEPAPAERPAVAVGEEG